MTRRAARRNLAVDRRKIDDVLTSLRDIEKRIARVESENERELTRI